MKEIYDNARDLMKGFCRVCKKCDGKACADEVPGMGGLGSGASFHANIKALEQYALNMLVIHNVVDTDTTISLFDKKMSLPIIAAPIGGVSFNMGGKITEEDYISSVLKGCKAKNIIGCIGDGVPDFIHETGNKVIKEIGGYGIPFIKPWEDKELFEKIEKAEKFGVDIIGMDIDAAGLVTLRKMGRPVTPKSPEKLKKIIESTSKKFIIKGVMTVTDAKIAVDIGANGIVVSNHGGRVMDYARGSADVLPDIADAVKGKITLMVDGGVRSGADVLKMLALGADFVMIGRPFSIAALGGLQKGVETYIEKLHTELEQHMVLTGTKSVTSVQREIIHKD